MRASYGWAVAAIVLAASCKASPGSDFADARGVSPDGLPDTLSPIGSLHIGAGLFFSCGLRPDGSVACWGYGENGTLGNGSNADATAPVSVSNLSGALALSVSGYNACVLAADRTVACWGNDFDGELGDNGTSSNHAIPNQVGGVKDAVQVAIGGSQGCALLANTTIECWGGPVLGGDVRPALIANFAGVVAMAPTTSDHQCAVMDDATIRCWGADDSGQLGDGQSGQGAKSAVPVTVGGLGPATAVAVSYGDTCALLADRTVWCLGDNSRATQLGNGSTASTSLVPVQVSGLTDVVQITAGDYFACATKADGTAWCWGDNSFGSLGNGTTTNSGVPVPVSGLSNVVGVACGDEHVCAQLGDGRFACWGGNNNGGLGSATTTRCPQGACSTTPLPVTF